MTYEYHQPKPRKAARLSQLNKSNRRHRRYISELVRSAKIAGNKNGTIH